MPTTDIHTTPPRLPSTAPAPGGASPSAARRFGRVPAHWLEDPGVGVEELAVLTALAVHADRDGVCVVRQRTLAGLLQRSREWVCRVLARLCEPGGFVEKEHRADRDGWNLACRYRLPDLAAPEDSANRYPPATQARPLRQRRGRHRAGWRRETATRASRHRPSRPCLRRWNPRCPHRRL